MKVTQMNAFTPSLPQNKTEARAVYSPPAPHSVPFSGNIGKILSEFKKDDYILLGIIAVLIFEGCDDYILLTALGYIFFMGIR